MRNNDVILQTVTRVMTFIILTFAVFLFMAGHNNPGGGFIGGLVFASGITLLFLAFDLKTVRAGFPLDFPIMAVSGVLIALLTAMGSFLFGRPFLSHTFGYFDLPIFGETELATAVLFDVGVGLAVLGTALTIIYDIREDISIWKH
ncbi:Na(+)/H(+) antiporter subunit B [Desulfitobacterium sp. THU1]|uniref:Na(+)/H(+) antiporter subunit B n=1 Tax=Desulfitobacterium sp. THU1 TaxID=3138072 RepID=UPI00311E0005